MYSADNYNKQTYIHMLLMVLHTLIPIQHIQYDTLMNEYTLTLLLLLKHNVYI